MSMGPVASITTTNRLFLPFLFSPVLFLPIQTGLVLCSAVA